jgi:hypothetical protein
MTNKYTNLTGINRISEEYEKINKGFDGVEGDVSALQQEDMELGQEIQAHKLSGQAHNAASIRYNGTIPSIENTEQAIDYVDSRVNTIIGGSGEGKDPELTDIHTPDPSYTPARPITVAGDMMRDMQQQFNEQLAETVDEVQRLENEKAAKTEVNALATNKANEADLIITNNNVANLQTQLNAQDRGWGGTYATLTALQTAFPTGDSKRYVVAADGHWYFWDGTTWADGGLFEYAPLGEDSVDRSKVVPHKFAPFAPLKNLLLNALNPNQSTIDDQFHRFNMALATNPSTEYKRLGATSTLVHTWQDGIAQSIYINRLPDSPISEPLANYGLQVGDTMSFGLLFKLVERTNTSSFGLRVVITGRDNAENSTGTIYQGAYAPLNVGGTLHVKASGVIPVGTTRLRIQVQTQYNFAGTTWVCKIEMGAWYLIKGAAQADVYSASEDAPLDNRIVPIIKQEIGNASYVNLYVTATQQDAAYIYIKNSNSAGENYIRYQLKYDNIPADHYEGWRIQQATEVKRIGGFDFIQTSNYATNLTSGSGEWEAAIRQAGGAGDFIGGFHGDEQMISAFFEVDGQVIAAQNFDGNYSFKRLRFVQTSDFLSFFDQTPVARRIKIYDFDKDGFILTQKFTWLETTSLLISYLSMITLNISVFNKAYRDHNYVSYNLPSSENAEVIKDVYELAAYGNNATARMRIISMKPYLASNESFFSSGTGKAYFDGTRVHTANAGDKWEIVTRFTIDTSN